MAFELIVTAISRAGTTDAAALVQEIDSGSFDTALGTVSFTGGDPAGGRTGYLIFAISGSSFQEHAP